MEGFESVPILYARRGLALHKWVNDKTPGADAIVLTDATLVFNITEGLQVLIANLTFDLISPSDDAHINLVSCDEVNGGGNATDISGHTHVITGTAASGIASKERPMIPPIRVRYKDGARSITCKVHANDAGAVISCGWHGWVEKETR